MGGDAFKLPQCSIAIDRDVPSGSRCGLQVAAEDCGTGGRVNFLKAYGFPATVV